MKFRFNRFAVALGVACIFFCTLSSPNLNAQDQIVSDANVSVKSNSGTEDGRLAARLFWQDDSQSTIRWGDLRKLSSGWALKANNVSKFPALDVSEQSLVQMQADSGLVLVGVHDQSDGTFGSGWVAIESGIVEVSHGDHSHWHFKNAPSILHQQIDGKQGNPAHVYKYGKSFVMANDKKNGFTVTSSKALRSASSAETATQFYNGGNGHITLAVVDNQVAYATWIAQGGENRGRIDVIGLGANFGEKYSIKCPSGMLHGATTNSGKAFFAPADGICWVNVDHHADSPSTANVNHLSLGKDADGKPLRTGAFANLGNHVLFTAGRGDDAKLCLLNAESKSPALKELAIELSEGQTLKTPVVVKSGEGKSLAMIFRESKEAPETDAILFFELDPNQDGALDDLKLIKEVAVGRNQIEGHSGHHEAVVLPRRNEVAISNPGDGTLSIISLEDYSIVETISVKGVPTRLIAIGK